MADRSFGPVFLSLPSLVLGDQLWLDKPALLACDPSQDAVLMIEATCVSG